jgi:hypothetical protein
MSNSRWSTSVQRIANGVRIFLLRDSAPLTIHDFLKLLARNAHFADWYSAVLAASRFEAFFWELPALCLNAIHHDSEFVLLDAPALTAQAQDQRPFNEHFAANEHDISVFTSLGGDAQLIAPCPTTDIACYSHLAVFIRQAPVLQRQHFWHATAATALELMSDKPRWLSTSGLGVSWLHARLDQKPKYFQHKPYKAPA